MLVPILSFLLIIDIILMIVAIGQRNGNAAFQFFAGAVMFLICIVLLTF